MDSDKGKKKMVSLEEMEEMQSQRQKEKMKMKMKLQKEMEEIKLEKEMDEMESQEMGESLDSLLDRQHLVSKQLPKSKFGFSKSTGFQDVMSKINHKSAIDDDRHSVANLRQRRSFSGHFRFCGSADASSSSRPQLPMSMADLSNLHTTRLDLTKITSWSPMRRMLKSLGDEPRLLPISTTSRHNCDNNVVAKLFKAFLDLLFRLFYLMIQVLILVGMTVDTQLASYTFGKVDHILERMNGHDTSPADYVQRLAYSCIFLLLILWLILNFNTSQERSQKEEQVHSFALCLGGMAVVGFVIVSLIGFCSQLSPFYAVVQVSVWVLLLLIALGFRAFWK